MDPIKVNRALVLVPDDARNEQVVNRGFWRKVRKFAGRVPFMEEAVSAYYCAIDPATPKRVRMIILAALAYFVMPVDLIPDFIAGFGFSDDASVLMAVIGTIRSYITDTHTERARKALLQDKGPESVSGTKPRADLTAGAE